MTTTTEVKVRKAATKNHGHCIYTVREVNSPQQKVFRGYRMVVAVPNMNGHKAFSSEAAPSFARSFMLFQSSDYNQEELDEKVAAHVRWLLNRGFTKVEPAEVYAQRINMAMAQSKGTQHVTTDDDEETEAANAG